MNSRPRPKILLDCDPGHDDALAILVAARHADVVGITTVAGNASLDHTTRNALVVCELAGLDVPVHAGAGRPLVAPARYGQRIHGPTGLDGPAPTEPTRRVDGTDAAAFIVEMARATEALWLVPTGPLTNVALAIRRAPDIVERLAGISFMGGSAGAGNVTAAAEFNVWADPEAAAIVLDCGAQPLRMSGLNLTRQFVVDDGFVAALRPHAAAGHRPSRFCADMLAFYVDRQEAVSGRRAGPAHDVCAVLAVTHPELLNAEPRAVVVELGGRHTRGMTLVDERPRPTPAERVGAPTDVAAGGSAVAPANVEVGYRIDAAAAHQVLVDAILAAGPLS